MLFYKVNELNIYASTSIPAWNARNPHGVGANIAENIDTYQTSSKYGDEYGDGIYNYDATRKTEKLTSDELKMDKKHVYVFESVILPVTKHSNSF